MTDDTVERLRDLSENGGPDSIVDKALAEAADEIVEHGRKPAAPEFKPETP